MANQEPGKNLLFKRDCRDLLRVITSALLLRIVQKIDDGTDWFRASHNSFSIETKWKQWYRTIIA